MIRFGYHPMVDDLEVALKHGPFDRAIVIDEPVSDTYETVGRVRVSADTDTGLPTGIYWFTGVDEPMIMQVGAGPMGTSEEFTLDAWSDTVEHPLAEAYRWAEHLWEAGIDVPAPQFDIGDRAITVRGGSDVDIKGRTYSSGSWSYDVRGDGGLRKELERKLARIEAADLPEDWVLGERSTAARFGATLTRTKLKGRFSDTVYSYRATRTVFRPYQFKPVLKLLQSGQARILIADEVGLGKTIEAGLIWTELEARHEADRVLIVCPANLIDKWRDEMQERFGFDVTHLNSDELKRFLEQHQEGRVPKRKAYVASLESLRTWKGLEALEDNPPEFDLVIVDEAHSMRNTDTKSYALGTQLAEWTSGSNMVFLTATPINLHQTDLLHLLGLLEPADYESIVDLEMRLQPNEVLNRVGKMLRRRDASAADFHDELRRLRGLVYEKVITSRPEYEELTRVLERAPLAPKDIAGARRLISELNALSTTVTRTRRSEIDEKKPIRDAEPGIQVEWSPEEYDFYQEYLQWCEQRALIAETPMYFSMQMPIRLASTSVHLAAREVLRADPENWEGDTQSSKNAPALPPHTELVAAARRVLEIPDTKLKLLGHVLDDLRTQARQGLLFSWSKATLRYLYDAFKDTHRIAVLNGDVPRDRRRRIMKDFRDGRYDFVFANRVASEGLDFEFCSAVINYDLPWNPMEVEQRIGRIDRIGQESEKILIRNFYNDDAIDSRIIFRLLNRIEIFEKSIGELEPIIGQHMQVLESAMDFRLTPEQREAKAQQFLTAIEAQRVSLSDVAESAAGLIISSDVDIAGLQDELIATGRYIGQRELAHLLDDWVRTDDGFEVGWAPQGNVVELRGNSAMAARVLDLTQRGIRTRAETDALITDLQNQAPIHLSLDQELARTSGIQLLSANHPLVLAAAEVPGHRHARFASVKIKPTEHVARGDYLVVLAHAENASRGGDEIWGIAVNMDGVVLGEAAADAVLAALARGDLEEGPSVGDQNFVRLARRAQHGLEKRWREVQDRRDIEERALTESRRTILADQHQRRLRNIERRRQTLIQRDRGQGVLRMVEGQIRRQKERYQALLTELENKKPKAVALRYLAVCALEVTR